MSLLRRAEPDHRLIVATHEAGHVIAGQTYCRRTGFHATITESRRGWRGKTTATRRTWAGTDLEFVVFLLAGAAAAELLTGDPGLAGSSDLADARTVCREIGTTLAHGEQLAAAFARTHRRQIEHAAGQLYRTGRI